MGEVCAKRRRDENGYIVVETIGAFIPFVLLIISILSLVNIVTVQARVHYAMTQAANTLSMYSYTLEVLGVANDLTTLSNKAERPAETANLVRNEIGEVLSGIESLAGLLASAGQIGDVAGMLVGIGEDIVGDPKGALQDLMNYSLNELRNKVFEEMARPLVGRYLSDREMTGDEYLRRAGVVNSGGAEGLAALDFYSIGNLGQGNSVLIDGDGNVKLTVRYEVRYVFGGLAMPFSPTLRISQTVITKAWLNGSGKGYR